MKAQPKPASEATFIDLDAIARELHAEATGSPVRHVARTIVRESDLRVVVVAMEAGATLAEHKAAGTVALHVLHGRVTVRFGERIVEVGPQQLLPIASGAPHDVTALESSAFVLSLSRSQA